MCEFLLSLNSLSYIVNSISWETHSDLKERIQPRSLLLRPFRTTSPGSILEMQNLIPAFVLVESAF